MRDMLCCCFILCGNETIDVTINISTVVLVLVKNQINQETVAVELFYFLKIF